MKDQEIKIIFQNHGIIIVDKPAGVLTTPPRFSSDPRPVLGLQLQKKLGQQIFPVHRLDFEVSGLVIYALTENAHRAFNKKFESRSVYKTYQAFSQADSISQSQGSVENPAKELLNDIPRDQRFTWTSQIIRGKKRSFESPAGAPSLTEGIRHLDIQHPDLGLVTPWSLFPMTGRPHQLRFEMYKHGYPILNDILYSGKVIDDWENRIALRAVSLKFDNHSKGDRDFLEQWSIPAKFEVANLLFER